MPPETGPQSENLESRLSENPRRILQAVKLHFPDGPFTADMLASRLGQDYKPAAVGQNLTYLYQQKFIAQKLIPNRHLLGSNNIKTFYSLKASPLLTQESIPAEVIAEVTVYNQKKETVVEATPEKTEPSLNSDEIRVLKMLTTNFQIGATITYSDIMGLFRRANIKKGLESFITNCLALNYFDYEYKRESNRSSSYKLTKKAKDYKFN